MRLRNLEEGLNETKVCKVCGDKMHNPTTDCDHDCHDEHGDHWITEGQYDWYARDYVKSMAGPHQYDTNKWASLGDFFMKEWDWYHHRSVPLPPPSPHPTPLFFLTWESNSLQHWSQTPGSTGVKIPATFF